METVQEVAAKHGAEFAAVWADHRIEALEAQIRSNRQALRALSDAVLTGDGRAIDLAQAVRDLMNTLDSMTH